MSSTPEVSIILPTYNRADTLGRAIDSVLAQSFQDWELIVVDDGSTDGTVDLFVGMDPRVHLVRQANAGVGAARNTGLAASRGRFLTFLDSDDAWLPHFLELTTSFLRHAPHEHFVTTEFNQDYGNGHVIRHNVTGVKLYASFARSIGSTSLDLPSGQTDEYLRVYGTKEAVGEWAQAGLVSAGLSTAQIYHGNIFRHMRWGYLSWLPVTMLTRYAYEAIGPFVTTARSAEDYLFMGLLAKKFSANMIGVPSAIKYEKAVGTTSLQQDHLATGGNSYSFEMNKLAHFQKLFKDEFFKDPELSLILRHYQMYTGFAALRAGMRSDAIQHLGAAACWKPHLRRAYAMIVFAMLSPSDRAARDILDLWFRGSNLVWRVMKGHTSLAELLYKMLKQPS
jgi:glycosyltransferase involved in cell wall biosynthesis